MELANSAQVQRSFVFFFFEDFRFQSFYPQTLYLLTIDH